MDLLGCQRSEEPKKFQEKKGGVGKGAARIADFLLFTTTDSSHFWLRKLCQSHHVLFSVLFKRFFTNSSQMINFLRNPQDENVEPTSGDDSGKDRV